MDTARLFQDGRSQAVRLPKSYRFEGQQVYIKRIGRAVVLLPYDAPWQSLVESLDQFSDDFLAERHHPDQQVRAGLID